MAPDSHGTWATVRIHCGDGRIQKAVLEHAESFGGFSDPVTAPGGVKNFISDEACRKLMLDHIGVYVRLHHPSQLLVIQHEDCGAYGGKQVFGDDQKERALHREELEKASEILEAEFPHLEIISGFVKD